jgi:hypothetical protein
MQPHSIVVVSLHTPKEKIWGELVELQEAGLTVRGIRLLLTATASQDNPD